MNTFELALFGVVIMVAMWLACDWVWDTVAERSARATAIADQSRTSLARAIRREDRRPLSDRIAGDVANRGFYFPAAAHAPEKLDRDSEYARGTVLSLVPKA